MPGEKRGLLIINHLLKILVFFFVAESGNRKNEGGIKGFGKHFCLCLIELLLVLGDQITVCSEAVAELGTVPVCLLQIRNMASGLCIDSKHGSTGTELRLDACLKEGAERTWAHEQVRLTHRHKLTHAHCCKDYKNILSQEGFQTHTHTHHSAVTQQMHLLNTAAGTTAEPRPHSGDSVPC